MFKHLLRFVLLVALAVPLGTRAQLSFPVTMGFEDADSTAYAQWTKVLTASSAGITSTNPHSGAKCFDFYYTTTPPQYLISPEFEVATGTEVFTFWYQPSTSYDEEFAVGFSSTTNEVASFTFSATVEVESGSPWTEYMAVVPAGTKYVAIKHLSDDEYHLYIDDIRIGSAPTCFRVQSIAAHSITSESMTIGWIDTSLNAQSYSLTYWPNGAGAGDTMTVTVNDTTYDLYGLQAQTLYYFSVVPTCSEGEILPREGSAMTHCEGGSCNITIYAEDSYGDGWNGNTINVYQSGALMGSFMMPTQDMSSTRIYDTASIMVCSGSPVVLTFTEGSYASEMGGYIADGSGSPIFTIANMSDRDTLVSLANPCPSCIAPTALRDSVDEDGNIVFMWNAAEAGTYLVYVGDSLYTEEAISENYYVFTDLLASTAYTLGVAKVCGSDEGDTSGIIRLSMRTPCGAVTELPWSYGFEDADSYTVPACWTVVDSTEGYSSAYPYVYDYSGYAHSGTKSLEMAVSYPEDVNLIATPAFAVNPAMLHVKFYAIGYSWAGAGSTFQAGVMRDPADASTFIPLFSMLYDDMDYTQSTMYEFFSDTLTTFEPEDTVWVAFRLGDGDDEDGWYTDQLYIDDIEINFIPNCRMPLGGSGSIDNVTYESADFEWTGTSENGYDLMLKTYILNDTTGEVIDSTEAHFLVEDSSNYTVNTLQPNTIYYAYVATLCEGDEGMDTTDYLYIGPFMTQMRCYPVVKGNVVAVAADSATIEWEYLADMGIASAGARLTLTDLTDATVAPVTEVVAGISKSYTGLTVDHTYRVEVATLCGTQDTAETVEIFFSTHGPLCGQYFTDDEAATSSSYAPAYYSASYSFSQTIYSDTILNGLDTLKGVSYNAYFYNSDNADQVNYSMDIYLGFVDSNNSHLTSYNNNLYLASAIPDSNSNMTKVVTGRQFTVGSNGWVYIPFDSLYTIPAHNNQQLVVTTVTTTKRLGSGYNYWRAKNTYTYDYSYQGYYTSRYAYSSSSPITYGGATAPSSYSNSNAPNIQFFGNCEGACMAPTATLANSGSDNVTVSWIANGAEDSWSIEYKAPTDSVWTVSGIATASPYTINGLTPSTNYSVRVGAICGDTIVYGVLSARTDCAPVTIPYTAVFTAAVPCWNTNVSYYSTTGINIFSNYYAISPLTAVPINTLMARVTASAYSSSTVMLVGIGNGMGGDFTPIDTVSLTGTQSTTDIYLINYTGTGDRLVIKPLAGASSSDFYLYSVTLMVAPHCMPADSLVLDSATATSLSLSWKGTATSYDVKYKVAGDTTATWTTLTATTNNITINGLTPATRYEVKVSIVCSDGTLSADISDSYSTECLPATVPFLQQLFYEIPICWETFNTGRPNATWAQSAANSANYGYGYLYSIAGSSSNVTNDWLVTPAITIPASADTNFKLCYMVAGDADSYYANAVASYEIRVSPTGDFAEASFTDTMLVDTINTNVFLWRRLPVSAYAGQTVRFAFHAVNKQYGEVAVTNVGVRNVLAPMYYLDGDANLYLGDTGNYSVVRVEGDSATTTLTWNSTMVDAGTAVMIGSGDSIRIVYNAAGFDTITFVASNAYGNDTSIGVVRIVDPNPVTTFPYMTGFEATAPDNNNWIINNQRDGNGWYIGNATDNGGSQALYISQDNGTTNTYEITTSSYSYAARALSFPDSGAYSFSFDWKAYGESNYDFLFAWLAPGDATFPAGSYPGDMESYTDNPTGWINLNPEGGKLNLDSTWSTVTDTVNVTAGRYFLVFMWRNDLSMGTNPPAAIDNIVVTDGTVFVCDAPVIDTMIIDENYITVDFSAEAENFEVAIVEGEWAEPLVADSAITGNTYTFTGLTASTTYAIGLRSVCAEGIYSGWEVRTVTTAAHPCDVPTALTSSNVTLNSATLGWTAVEGQEKWQIHLTGEGYDQYHLATANPFNVTGLSYGVEYTFQVRAICSEGDTSEWSTPAHFTTIACEGVTNVTVGSVTANSAVISWTAPTGATRFVVNYGFQGFDQGTGSFDTVENATSCTLSGLTANTPYDVYVRTLCEGGTASAWSSVVNFTTSRSTGIDDVNAANVSLYPNPASSTVTLKGIEGKATVTVVDMNGRKAGEWTVNEGELTIDVTDMAQGAYFVRIVGEQVNAIRKLIVR